MEFGIAFILGFFGSVHCVGMCGPIAISLPGDRNKPVSMVMGGLLYNSGRIITYAFFGLIFGFFGMATRFAGYQSLLSILIGVLIIAFALLPRLNVNLSKGKFYTQFSNKLSRSIGVLFRSDHSAAPLMIGILNGFLPCGLVVTALAAALVTDSVIQGSIFMALFGLGTLPAMLLMNMAPMIVKPELRSRLRPLSTYFAIFLGSLLIYRGIMVSEMM